MLCRCEGTYVLCQDNSCDPTTEDCREVAGVLGCHRKCDDGVLVDGVLVCGLKGTRKKLIITRKTATVALYDGFTD